MIKFAKIVEPILRELFVNAIVKNAGVFSRNTEKSESKI